MEEKVEIIRKAIEDILFNTKYLYKFISPPEILRKKKGILNLGGLNVMGQAQAKAKRAMTNRSILETYCNELGSKGWELVTDINYANLPYGGNLVFKKAINKEDEAFVFELDEKTEDEKEFDKKGELTGMTSYETKQKAREEYIRDKRAKRGLVKKKEVSLEDKYAEETGKNAVYRGNITKGFMKWKEVFMNKLHNGEDVAITSKEEK